MFLSESQIEDLRLAASKMTGACRREFQAQMTIKYCDGNARKAERRFGWGRKSVKLGLEERRSGITCLGLQSSNSGAKKWEELHPRVAKSLEDIAEDYAQQNPTFKSTIADTRLTASEAINQLKKHGFSESEIPAPSTMALVLNRMGYRLRKVLKAKPQKKLHKPTLSSKISAAKTAEKRRELSD